MSEFQLRMLSFNLSHDVRIGIHFKKSLDDALKILFGDC